MSAEPADLPPSLARLGWGPFFAAQLGPGDAAGAPARVSAVERTCLRLLSPLGESEAVLPGRLRDAAPAERPVTGDWVIAEASRGAGPAVVRRVLERRSAIARRRAGERRAAEHVLAANVDVVFLVSALGGDLKARRIERYLAQAWESGAEPVVLLNKADLAFDPEADRRAVEDLARPAPVHLISAREGRGLEPVLARLAGGRTGVFLGSSGVGKSTLTNRLAGAELQATRELSLHDGRGVHTTTRRELVLLPGGGLAIDTPGLREVGLWDSDEGVERTFEEILALAGECAFRDCGHETEPGCAVRAAVEAGRLDPGRLAGWRKLGRELAHQERKEDHEARQAKRRRDSRLCQVARERGRRKR